MDARRRKEHGHDWFRWQGIPRRVRALSSISDEELCERAAKRDSWAFGALFERYVDRVHKIIMNTVKSIDDAQGLTQDAFLKFFEALVLKKSFDRRRRVRPYLAAIAWHLAINHIKRGKKEKTGLLEKLEEIHPALRTKHDPLSGCEKDERARKVEIALERLPEKHREAIVLFWEMMEPSDSNVKKAVSDVSSILNVDRRTAKNLIRAGLRLMINYLKEE